MKMLTQELSILNLHPKSFYDNIYDILIMNNTGIENFLTENHCLGIFFIAFLGLSIAFSFSCCPPHEVEPFPVCSSQEDKVIDLIKIHTDHVNGLRDNILWTRQVFFLVMTGLMAYYLKGNGAGGKNKQNDQLKSLGWLLFFAMIVCYLNEGVLNYWQAQHLNKIYQLEEGLEAELFPWHAQLQETFIWIKLPNCGGETLNIAVFVLGLKFHPTSSVFYFGTFIILLLALQVIESGRSS